MKTPLPEPVAWRFDRPGISKLDSWPHGGDWERLHTESQLRAAMVAAWNDAIDDVIGLLEGGSFLHEDAPAARMVRVAVPAIRTLKETP